MSTFTMPFGKHKGVPITQVELKYLEWLAQQPELHASTKKAIDDEVARRKGVSDLMAKELERRGLTPEDPPPRAKAALRPATPADEPLDTPMPNHSATQPTAPSSILAKAIRREMAAALRRVADDLEK